MSKTFSSFFLLFVCCFSAFFHGRFHVSRTSSSKCGHNQCTGSNCALPPEQATSVPVPVVLCCVLVCSFLFSFLANPDGNFKFRHPLLVPPVSAHALIRSGSRQQARRANSATSCRRCTALCITTVALLFLTHGRTAQSARKRS
ncbi:hypothetical protein HDV64DRAFT_245200, partial [Trichoderma sp. TUCIM 5745]